MFGTQNLALFVSSGILLNLTPGQDTFYILGRSIAQGRRAGVLSVLGIISGCSVHTVAAALGLSAILATSTSAFLAVKLAGAAYLSYLGIRMLLSREADPADARKYAEDSAWEIYRAGFFTNLLNPKVALFFLAFLPQFCRTRRRIEGYGATVSRQCVHVHRHNLVSHPGMVRRLAEWAAAHQRVGGIVVEKRDGSDLPWIGCKARGGQISRAKMMGISGGANMFRKITLSLTVAGLLCAQSNVQVHKTELAVPFGVAAGKLAVMDQNLVFVDDEKPEASFAIARESVKQLTAEAETVTVELSKAIRDRSGDRTQLHFRMPTPAAATTLSQWYQAKPVRAGAAGITAAGSAPDVPPTATYAAKHKHFPFGECSGRLLVFDGRLAYESVTEVNHSRAWQFRDIKEAKQKSPYEIELGPFDGNNYTFLMGEKGMAPPEFKALVDKITAARAAR